MKQREGRGTKGLVQLSVGGRDGEGTAIGIMSLPTARPHCLHVQKAEGDESSQLS